MNSQPYIIFPERNYMALGVYANCVRRMIYSIRVIGSIVRQMETNPKCNELKCVLVAIIRVIEILQLIAIMKKCWKDFIDSMTPKMRYRSDDVSATKFFLAPNNLFHT